MLNRRLLSVAEYPWSHLRSPRQAVMVAGWWYVARCLYSHYAASYNIVDPCVAPRRDASCTVADASTAQSTALACCGLPHQSLPYSISWRLL